MKLNIFHTPIRCPVCLNRPGKRDACVTCAGTGFMRFSAWLEALSDAGLQDVVTEASAILSEREMHAARAVFMDIEQAAAYKGVHRLTLNAILNNETRRAATFPGARRIGRGTRSMWQIPVAELAAWTPRKDSRRRSGD